MGISGHFGIENYARRLGIVQNLSEYCRFFLCDFLGQNCADTPNIHTTDVYPSCFSLGIPILTFPKGFISQPKNS